MSRRRRTNFGIVQVKFTFNDNGGGLGDVTNVGFSRAIVRFYRSNTQSSARIYVNRRPIAPRASQAMPQNQNRSTWLRASPGADRPSSAAASHPSSEPISAAPGSGSHETCMGLFLSSGCFWVLLPVLCSERQRPFFVPSPAIRFPERAEGVKGPKR